LEDEDLDGVCDAFEIAGCTASNACNYMSEATDDDGSCDFCSCADGLFGNYGLEIEVVETHEEGVLMGMTTYRFYVTTASPMDFVSSIYGSDVDTLSLNTTTSWHHDSLGADYAQGVNPSLYDMFPDLAFDSWLTIGLEGPADIEAGEQEVNTLGPPTGGWLLDFAAGNSIQVDDPVGGAWFILNGASNGVAGDDLRVLVAQLTTDGEISGRINAQIFGEGEGANDLRFTFDFVGNEWLNNGGVTNSCGCTDDVAYNYDETAEYDDGACAYCELIIAEVETQDVTCNGSSDGFATVLVEGASTDSVNYTFMPEGPDGLDSLWTGLGSGTYEVMAIDGNGCGDTVVFEIFEPDALVLTVDEVVDQTEGEENGSIGITATGGTLDYTFDWTGLGGVFSSDNEDVDGLVAGDYEVVVTDANGCTIGSGPITINVIIGLEEFQAEFFSVWPNPSSEFMMLKWESPLASVGKVVIFDSRGRQVHDELLVPGSTQLHVDVGHWSTGNYLITVQINGHLRTSQVHIVH
jgi:hypothetical protein